MNVRRKRGALFSGDMIKLPTAGAERMLGDVRGDLRKALAEGEVAYCPCCGVSSKVYARGINHMMIRTMRELAAVDPRTLTSAEITKRTGQTGGGDTSRLVYWGFIEPWPEHSWKITAKGRQFLVGAIRVPHKALEHLGQLIGFDTSIEVSVEDVVGKKFDLDEVLAPRAVAEADVRTA